jgi:hypothetical protein
MSIVPRLWFSIPDWLAETQFDDLECRDLLHAGRAEYHYGVTGLNLGLEAMATGASAPLGPGGASSVPKTSSHAEQV